MRQRILITGASEGLGKGMAELFAAEGRTLGLCARRFENLKAIKADLEKKYPSCSVHIKQLDVNDHEKVAEVFKEFETDMGGIDRVIVNAGVGHAAPIGKGKAYANLKTATTNFVSAIAQCESAMEIFRKQNHGHLVVISSVASFRGMRGAMTVYSATKAGVAAVAEGLRDEMITQGIPIKVTTLFPGFIDTAINADLDKLHSVDLETGCKALVKAIESEKAKACVPTLPWTIVGLFMRNTPDFLIRHFT